MKARFRIYFGNHILIHALNGTAIGFIRTNELPYYFFKDQFSGKMVEVVLMESLTEKKSELETHIRESIKRHRPNTPEEEIQKIIQCISGLKFMQSAEAIDVFIKESTF